MNNGVADGVGREQADPVGGVDGQADDLNSEPRVVVGDERILEEADSSRNANRKPCSQCCHGGRGHLEDAEVDEVPVGGNVFRSLFSAFSPCSRLIDVGISTPLHAGIRTVVIGLGRDGSSE